MNGEKLLFVDHKDFCAGAVFVKQNGQWKLIETAPILRWLFNVNIKDIPKRLTSMGCKWEWVNV